MFYPPGEPLAPPLEGLGSRYAQAAGAASALLAARERDSLAELRVDHAHLFVGPFGLQAAPYGSVYLERGRRVMGDSTLAAARLYAQVGLRLREDFKDLPDHIAVELEFMHYLAWLEAEALATGATEKAAEHRQTQRRFLAEHLRAWLPEFCEAVRRNARTAFYRLLVDCVLAFVCEDAAAMGAVNDEAEGQRGPL